MGKDRRNKGNAILAVLYIIVIISFLTALIASSLSRDARHFRLEWKRAQAADKEFSLNEKKLMEEELKKLEGKDSRF